ncbi:hypothetical protein [Duganella callida]|uniref:Uncharacterized protein n=1 Tax=Duganella callida TaxID=2561932 RepID=A0A4Y9STH3_9BURK|nr:hypothetical protein [Duganella callida]TFW28534.1 hypothetical protein E4L98_05485 [Duganella callida]
MIDIKMTINGRPLTEDNIRDELERAVLEQIRVHVQDQLKNVPSELNGERLHVELQGSDLDNLSVHLSGPDQLIEQAKQALGAE